MKKSFDFITIGDIVVDNFIKLNKDLSGARETTNPASKGKELCLSFGDKIPFESSQEIPAVGNSANAAVSIARLGLNPSIISTVGNDVWGKTSVQKLKNEGVITDYIDFDKQRKTNYHYVLWYKDDRTILVKHEDFAYIWPKELDQNFSNRIPNGQTIWVYLSSLGEHTLNLHNQIADFLEQNQNVKLVFQPGTFQIKFGAELLKRIYAKTDLFFCNVEEAETITGINFGGGNNIEMLLRSVQSLGPKIPVITNGHAGSYTLIDDKPVLMPIYPDLKPPLERTGAGDAFASTFSACFAMGKPIEDCLKWASINSMNVCQHVGAQEGLLNSGQIQELLSKAPKNWGVEPVADSNQKNIYVRA